MSNGSGVLRLNRFSYQDARMGFDPASLGMITLAATSAAAGAASASAQKKSAEATRQAADANAATLRNEVDLQNRQGWKMPNACSRRCAPNGRSLTGRRPILLLRKAPFQSGTGFGDASANQIQDEAAEAMRNAQSLYNRANTSNTWAAPMREPRKPSNGHPALRIRPGRKYPPQW